MSWPPRSTCGSTVSIMTEPPRPPGAGDADDQTWILIAHFGGAAGALLGAGLAGWIVPLVVLLAKGDQSPVVRAETVKALNFQLLWSIIGVVGWATACFGIGVVVATVAGLIAVVFGVVAGVKASNGEPYDYPLYVRMIK